MYFGIRTKWGYSLSMDKQRDETEIRKKEKRVHTRKAVTTESPEWRKKEKKKQSRGTQRM